MHPTESELLDGGVVNDVSVAQDYMFETVLWRAERAMVIETSWVPDRDRSSPTVREESMLPFFVFSANAQYDHFFGDTVGRGDLKPPTVGSSEP